MQHHCDNPDCEVNDAYVDKMKIWADNIIESVNEGLKCLASSPTPKEIQETHDKLLLVDLTFTLFCRADGIYSMIRRHPKELHGVKTVGMEQ